MGTWKERINKAGTNKHKDPKLFAFECCNEILSKAKESGQEAMPYIHNALKYLSVYYYNPFLVRQMHHSIMIRLARKKAEQLVNGSVFKPPKPEMLKGDIFLGNVAGSNEAVALTRRHINENIGIWGRAGSGKTNLCQMLCLQLVQKGIPVRVFDYKGEYRDLLPYIPGMLVLNPEYDKFNPLEPIGDPKDWLQFLADTLQQDFNIHTETKFMWINYADKLYRKYGIYENNKNYPSMHDMKRFLLEEAEKKSTSASRRRKIHTCMEAINSLLNSIGDMLDCSTGYTEEALCDFSLVAYEMYDLSSNVQSWLSKLRLKHLHHRCFASPERNRLKAVGIFEEAKMLFSEELHKKSTSVDYIKQLITQGRSAGFGAILTDQNKNELADFVLNNLSSQICLNQSSPKEARMTGYSLRCNEEQIKQILFLKIPKAIVGMAGNDPFLIRIPKSPVEKHLTDKALTRIIRSKVKGSISVATHELYKEEVKKAEPKEEPGQKQTLHGFFKDLRDFLLKARQEPDLNVSGLYSSLGLSGRKGNRIKRQLLANMLIQEKTIHTGKRKRPIKKLEVTKKGNKVLQWLEKKVKAA